MTPAGPTGTLAVTGVGGFIGSAAARRYLERGWRVRGLDLPGVLAPPGVELISGSVTDDDAVARAVTGADVVLHAAALVAESGDWATFHALNSLAPRRVARAAQTAGARSFVHLSSVMVHGFDYRDGANEDDPLDPADNPYCWSKIQGEFHLRDIGEAGEFHVHIVRPGDVYGAGSEPWVLRPLRHMREGTFLYVDPARSVINHVYIDNLLDAIDVIVAAGADSHGVPYIVTDGQRTLARDFWGWFAQQLPPRRFPALPGWCAEPLIGAAAGVLPDRVRRRLDLDRQSIRYLRRHGVFDISRVRALGWQPRIGLDEGLAITADQLRAQGVLGARHRAPHP